MIELCREYLSVWCIWLYVLIMSCTHFRVNPHSIVSWMLRNSLLETGIKYEVWVTATGLEPKTIDIIFIYLLTPFIYDLSGCWFESRCSYLNFRFCTCIEQGVPWHLGKYRVWIHSEMRTWHDKNIKSNAPYR